jgi:hypothetical protein
MNAALTPENRWNDTEGGKRQYREKNFYHCHLLCYKFHMDCPGNETNLNPGSVSSVPTMLNQIARSVLLSEIMV